MRDCAAALADEYPGLELHGIVGDFERHLAEIPPTDRRAPRIVAFLGGTIGNFMPGTARRFLRRLRALLGPGDYLLLGTDLVKDIDVARGRLRRRAGVTAEFNRNMLRVLNRELDADFPVELFDHVAFFDPEREWIEMRLRARRACRVRIAALDLEISLRGAARSCAPRSRPSSRASGWRPTTRRRGWDWRAGTPTRRSCSR